MEHKDNIGLYDDELLTPNGIKFTHREIDVLSCIFHTRGSSKIASILSISSRTVETHTANIMRKMDTNSREGIIDFLEKHNHSALIKKHYQALLLQITFKKKLNDVRSLLKDKDTTGSIIYDSQLTDMIPFIIKIKTHLSLCGLKVDLVESNKFSSKTIQDSGPTTHVIYILNSDSDSPKPDQIHSHMESDASLSKSLTTYVMLNSQSKPLNETLPRGSSPRGISKDSIKDSTIVLMDIGEEYEVSFFNLLQNLFPTVSLKEIIDSFKQAQQSIPDAPGKDFSQTPILSRRGIPGLVGSLRGMSILILLTLIIFTPFAIYLFTEKTVKHVIGNTTKTDPSIRSDFIVPSKSTLLDRPSIMAKIEEGLSGSEGIKTVAIVGIGGAGKSTIARRFALKQNLPVVWEINAASRETIMDSFERLAYALCASEEERQILQGLKSIKAYVERDEKILLFVKGKLKAFSKWLLLYDNVEKFASIRKYFPYDTTVWGKGRILITTSNSNTKNNSLINHFIYIGELSSSEKLQLFNQIMGTEKSNPQTPTQQEATLFLNDIPPFPLDVSIAAYYLKSTGISYSKYLERLKEDNKDFETIQTDVVKEASGYTKTRYNIISLSLIQLLRTHKDFQDLMLMSTLLDYQKIPKILLASYKGETVVDNFIYNLKKYSLITSESTESSIATFSLHKSTQENIFAFLKKHISSKEQSPLILSIGNTLENSIIEAIDDEDFSKMKLFAPHCEAFLSHDKLLGEPLKSSIGGALGCIYYYLWDKNKAKYLLETNLSNLKHYPDRSPDKTARMLVYLASFYRSVGNYKQAKQLLMKSLTIFKLNPDHLINARALGALGVVYRDLGEYKKAKDLLQESLEIHETYFRNQIGHAWILSKLGNIYMLLGDYPKARVLLEQGLQLYKMQAEDYIGVAWVLSHLGTVYERERNPKRAIDLINQSLSITRKYFYDDHIFVASGLAALGSVYAHNGNFEAAKKMLQESLKIYEKNYGIDHIETAHVQRVLGEAYLIEGDLETAESLFNKSLLVFQRKQHPEGYMSLENLSDLYRQKASQALSDKDRRQGQNFTIQARNYLTQALEILNDTFDQDSPHITKIKGKLSDLN